MVRLPGGDSDNFFDRTGQGGGFGGGGGQMLGCLLPLILSRFGLGGVVLLVIGYFILTSIGGGGGILGGGGGTQQGQSSAEQSTLSADDRRLLTGVLESTDQVWAQLFQTQGEQYAEPKLIAYTRGTQTACGFGQAAMGPFYCPPDQSIYIDPVFFDELGKRFGAPGDFASAYVIGHEVGHHVQNLTGALDRAQSAQARAGKVEGNEIQVGVELQADCYAGVWAANARVDGQPILEPGDVEEGMRAAEAIGDDTLQRQTQGQVVPESFTHGTSEQRMQALRTGLQSGDPAACQFNR